MPHTYSTQNTLIPPTKKKTETNFTPTGEKQHKSKENNNKTNRSNQNTQNQGKHKQNLPISQKQQQQIQKLHPPKKKKKKKKKKLHSPNKRKKLRSCQVSEGHSLPTMIWWCPNQRARPLPSSLFALFGGGNPPDPPGNQLPPRPLGFWKNVFVFRFVKMVMCFFLCLNLRFGFRCLMCFVVQSL